jgi:hypothetical protein
MSAKFGEDTFTNRKDAEAEVMKQATDPQAILEILQNKLDRPST